jgi:toxin YoeB
LKKRKNHLPDRDKQTAAGPYVRRQSRLDPKFLEDLQFWVGAHPRTAARILQLVQETTRDPFTGTGKPEALRGTRGIWSRRIDDEHRLTYRVSDEHVDFLQARFHYQK